MTQHRPVPRLDLAPKLNRPLSVWNPLDYLRLFYWVFYFPQALRWYVDTFGGGYIPPHEMNWRKGWEWLRQNPIQRNLFLQGLVLTVATPSILGFILQKIGFPFNWLGVASGMLVNMILGVALSMTGEVRLGVALSKVCVAGGVAFGVAFGVAGDVTLGVAFGVVFSLIFSLMFLVYFNCNLTPLGFICEFLAVLSMVLSLALGVVGNLVRGVTEGVALGIAFGVAFGVTLSLTIGVIVVGIGGVDGVDIELGMKGDVRLGVVFGVTLSVVGGMTGGVALGVAFGVALGVALIVAKRFTMLHPESWLIGSFFNISSIHNHSFLLSRVTPLPLPCLAQHLQNGLQQDWETGVHNVNQLLAYTLQSIAVIKAVKTVLSKTPAKQIIWRVSKLAEDPFDWKLVSSVSHSDKPIGIILAGQRYCDSPPPHAAAAGFWYLHEQEPAKAMEAFAVVRDLLYGEEMFTLAQTLTACNYAKELANIVTLQLPAFPPEPLLRPTTWQVLGSLSRVVEDVHLVQRSVSKATRSFALNRALGELKNILNNQDSLPKAERDLIVNIAQTWQNALLNAAGEVGDIAITKPVRNPYIVGDPVEGNLFVGREDVMRQLEELWIRGRHLQSVVIYGHRRMGKTSILINAANSLGSGVKVAYVNLQRSAAQGVGEVLMAISDVISEVVNLQPPDDEDLLKLPYRNFERYLKQVVETLHATSLQGLIIALDEFEKIEELIEARKIPPDFMGFLRGLVQMSPKLGFAFAGLHTLEEMTADYFQPFFASVLPIRVGFIKCAATRQILANPDEDFLLDYTPEALDQIYALTHGQPYLVQLVGFLLVRRYNDYVFEQGRTRNPTFTLEDVEAVVNKPKLFQQGRYYFDGVWGQAAQGAAGQQEVLKVLAAHREGLSQEAINMDEESLQEALKTLKRHDVVEETEGRWRIIVELFRRWVFENKMN